MIELVYTDGGKSESGVKKGSGDCAVRALAIAAELPYLDALRLLEVKQGEWLSASRSRHARGDRGSVSPLHGTWREALDAALAELGWQWHATMRIGSGCTMRLRASELPSGRIIVRLSRHYAAVIDGVLHDDHDCSRGGTRCVYGYWAPSRA